GEAGVPVDPATARPPPRPVRTLEELKREHHGPPLSRRARHEEHAEQSPWRNYVRDLVLGFNDGVVSVYALVAGVAGAQFSAGATAVAGVAAAVAGAVSMGLGEYISTKSQTQYYEAEARREREHIRKHPQLERQELREMYEEKGYPPDIVDRLVEHVTADESRFVDTMMREEFGVGSESSRSAVVAMALVMLAFLVGAALPVAPYLLGSGGLRVATLLSLGGLFLAGVLRARVSGLRMLRAGLEMVLLGAAAGLATYGVGLLVDGAMA
ncbi:MAG TPA: VIT1/CCC1 transporter family protein, partial [Candidatus Thermoplasmatota archaeon]|nr:VIT1/CCC1 transporter family protein [Candidatus Thermoplasmatota archaeon]